ncbi:ead/Ea22-like family protein [Cronobacter sakazakii]|nr:ead/Ea22-like family protein [Cronobacter sakazakii]
MTIDTAKLKAVAEKVRWGDWSAYKPHSGARGYEVRIGSEAVAQHCLKDDAAFIAAAGPKAVLCLIAALEAAQKRNAELDERLLRYAGIATRRAEHVAELEKRIAELEARTVKLPSLNPQMFNDDVIFGYRKAQREAVEFCAAAGINLETGGEA